MFARAPLKFWFPIVLTVSFVAGVDVRAQQAAQPKP